MSGVTHSDKEIASTLFVGDTVCCRRTGHDQVSSQNPERDATSERNIHCSCVVSNAGNHEDQMTPSSLMDQENSANVIGLCSLVNG